MTSTIVTTLIGIGATAVIALIGWTLKKVADNLSKDIANLKTDLNSRMDKIEVRMGNIEVELSNLKADHARLEGKLDGVLISLPQDHTQQPNQATKA